MVKPDNESVLESRAEQISIGNNVVRYAASNHVNFRIVFDPLITLGNETEPYTEAYIDKLMEELSVPPRRWYLAKRRKPK